MDYRETLPSELSSMLSTLYSYECTFGPYNLQTLALGVQIAPLLDAAGSRPGAKLLLERAAKNLARFDEGVLPVRLRALELLRDHLIEDGELEPAAAVQRELLDCRIRSCPPADPQVAAEQACLARLLMAFPHPAEAA